MNSKLILTRSQRLLLTNLQGLTYQGVRCAGSKHGHDSHAAHGDSHGHGHGHDDHGHHETVNIKSLNTTFTYPNQHDKDTILPKTGTRYIRAAHWLSGKWTPDRDDVINNDKVNKLSAYYLFGNFSILQNKLLLNTLRFFFDDSKAHHVSHQHGLNGVKTSENGIFLYKSTQADGHIRSRHIDYLSLGLFGSMIFGIHAFAYMPFIYILLSAPRTLAILANFTFQGREIKGIQIIVLKLLYKNTFHAELLPHTEQVVFHKGGYFGTVQRIYVDIKNLEKIEAETVPNSESRQVFVFDQSGIWNREAVDHPLLN